MELPFTQRKRALGPTSPSCPCGLHRCREPALILRLSDGFRPGNRRAEPYSDFSLWASGAGSDSGLVAFLASFLCSLAFSTSSMREM